MLFVFNMLVYLAILVGHIIRSGRGKVKIYNHPSYNLIPCWKGNVTFSIAGITYAFGELVGYYVSVFSIKALQVFPAETRLTVYRRSQLKVCSGSFSRSLL